MKRTLALFLLFSLMLTACLPLSARADTPLPEFFTDNRRDLFQNRDTELPVAVAYRFDGVASGFNSLLCSPEAVNGVLDYLAAITVNGKSDISVSDSDAYYIFYMADGSTRVFHFEGGMLSTGGHNYNVTNGKKQTVRFPNNEEPLGECCPETPLREFYARYRDELPAEIRIDVDTDSRTVTEKDEISSLCEMLYYLTPCGSRDAAEFSALQEENALPVYSYTCTMPDGTEYVFRFVGTWLCMEFPEPIGTWGYRCLGLP